MSSSGGEPSIRTETITVPFRRRQPLDLAAILQKCIPYITIVLISMMAYSTFRSREGVPEALQSVPANLPVLNMPLEEETKLHKLETMPSIHEIKDSAQDTLHQAEIKGTEKLEDAKKVGKEKVEDLKGRLVDLKETGEKKIKQGGEMLGEKLEQVKQAGDILKEKVVDLKESGDVKLGELKHDLKGKMEEGKETVELIKEAGTEKLMNLKEAGGEKLEELKLNLKEKMSGLKEAGTEKLEDLKEVGGKKLEEIKHDLKGKIEESKEKTSDLLSKGKEKAIELKEGVKDKLEAVAEGMKETVGANDKEVGEAIKDKACSELHSLKSKAEDTKETLKVGASKWLPLSSQFGSFIQKIKDGIIADEELHQLFGRKHQWEKLSLQEKADIVTKEMHLMGDDVVEEMISRMEHEKQHHKCA